MLNLSARGSKVRARKQICCEAAGVRLLMSCEPSYPDVRLNLTSLARHHDKTVSTCRSLAFQLA